MLEVLNKTKEWLLDILLPKKCLGCGREGEYICKDCETFLSEAPPSEEVVSVWEYEGLIEKLIRKIKYDGCYDIISDLIAKAFQKIELNLPQDTYITYVPMYRKKEKRRGFNHAELIARRVGERTNRPVVKLLEKIKDNRSQVGLNPRERIENIGGIFAFKKGCLCPNNILLVDDFRISGITMKECFKVLRQAGAKNIWGFTLAGVV